MRSPTTTQQDENNLPIAFRTALDFCRSVGVQPKVSFHAKYRLEEGVYWHHSKSIWVHHDVAPVTILHELVHWASDKSRGNVVRISRSTSKQYAAEEIIAELGGAILCDALEIDADRKHVADYVKGYLEQLASRKMVVESFHESVRIAHWLVENSKMKIPTPVAHTSLARLVLDIATALRQNEALHTPIATSDWT